MDIALKKLFIFDLDGTLAKSKSPLDPDMAKALVALLAKRKVAVISGGGYPQFLKQFLASMPAGSERYSNLYLLPTSGTRLYSWKGTWNEEYAETLSVGERKLVLAAIDWGLKVAGYEKPAKVYGDLIEDRGSQVTFSALGQNAPTEEKYAWDPDMKKREKIAAAIRAKLPGYDVRIGGKTSLDVTKKGVNKGYGIRKLEQFLNMPSEDIIFIGDALFYGGNDYPAKATGVDCIQVSGPEETIKIINDVI